MNPGKVGLKWDYRPSVGINSAPTGPCMTRLFHNVPAGTFRLFAGLAVLPIELALLGRN
jgi:hypothetical protein